MKVDYLIIIILMKFFNDFHQFEELEIGIQKKDQKMTQITQYWEIMALTLPYFDYYFTMF